MTCALAIPHLYRTTAVLFSARSCRIIASVMSPKSSVLDDHDALLRRELPGDDGGNGGSPSCEIPPDVLWRLRLLDEFQAAELLNLRVSVLRRRRSRRLPPIFVRVSGQIRYRPVDLVAFVNSMKSSPLQGLEET
jgi:hypothetical protein